MVLIENENIIAQTAKATITLTNKRVRQEIGKDLTSISIHKVSCIKVSYSENFIYLVLGLLAIVTSIMMYFNTPDNISNSSVCLVIGFGFIAGYIMTRKHTIAIFSDSGEKIQFDTKGIGSDEMLSFINKVETAISNK